MLRMRWQFLRHCVDILLGRRRSYRPGALTAKIFIEFDRAQAVKSAQHKAAKPASALRSSPLSKRNLATIKAQRTVIRKERIAIKPVRKSLTTSRNVNRPVVSSELASAKRLSQHVIWLGKTPSPISTASRSSITARNSKVRASNVIALHRLEPLSRPSARIAA